MDKLKARIDELQCEIDMLQAYRQHHDVAMQKYIDQTIYNFRREVDSLTSELWRMQKQK